MFANRNTIKAMEKSAYSSVPARVATGIRFGRSPDCSGVGFL
jgi:hypothetical protein